MTSYPSNSWDADPGGPSFVPLPGPSPITQIALPLLAWLDDWLVSWGTVTLIRPGMAITATHVIESLMDEWNVPLRPDDGSTSAKVPFHLMMVQDRSEPGVGFMWRAYRAIPCAGTDVTVLLLAGYSDNWEAAPKTSPKITFHAPRIGTRVTAFGYPRTRTEIEQGKLDEQVVLAHHTDGHTAVGSVEDVHLGGRDARLRFPCFQTSAQFDPGMSGGPVFDENGLLCGIVCSGTMGDSLLNYAALLWPTGVARVDVSAEGGTPDIRTICEMAADGLVDVTGGDRIEGIEGGMIYWRPT
jgi:hypothetical protein